MNWILWYVKVYEGAVQTITNTNPRSYFFFYCDHWDPPQMSAIQINYKKGNRTTERNIMYFMSIHSHLYTCWKKRTRLQGVRQFISTSLKHKTERYEFVWRRIAQQRACQSPPQGISSHHLFPLCLLWMQGMNRRQALVRTWKDSFTLHSSVHYKWDLIHNLEDMASVWWANCNMLG